MTSTLTWGTVTKNITIIGAGGFAREALFAAGNCFKFRSERIDYDFAVEKDYYCPDEFLHGKNIECLDEIAPSSFQKLLWGIGFPAVRKRIYEDLKKRGFGHGDFEMVLDPGATIGPNVYVGSGTVICAGNILTTDIVVGRHCLLNLACTVGHDTVIEDFVTVSPGVNISGNCHISEGADIGTGAKLLPGIRIGKNAVIGAGAVVTKDIPDNATAVGVPAKVIKINE